MLARPSVEGLLLTPDLAGNRPNGRPKGGCNRLGIWHHANSAFAHLEIELGFVLPHVTRFKVVQLLRVSSNLGRFSWALNQAFLEQDPMPCGPLERARRMQSVMGSAG